MVHNAANHPEFLIKEKIGHSNSCVPVPFFISFPVQAIRGRPRPLLPHHPKIFIETDNRHDRHWPLARPPMFLKTSSTTWSHPLPSVVIGCWFGLFPDQAYSVIRNANCRYAGYENSQYG